MSIPVYCDAARRHDFVYLFDVVDGNPNGDPDAGNLPRVDPETMQGLVTDVAIKRKVRNWVDLTRGTEETYKIYVQDKGIALNDLHARAYTARNIKSTGTKQKADDVKETRNWMCENFYDIRTFGAVMTTSVNCGQVRGPMQLTFARSVSPIIPLDLVITRVAITKADDEKTTEIGRKMIVPYGLYLGYGYYVPHFAQQSGFSSEDLTIFWEAFQNAWDIDRAASRGTLTLQALHIFSHDNPRGNAPAHRLLHRLHVTQRETVQAPRRITDYIIELESTSLPEGITHTSLLESIESPKS